MGSSISPACCCNSGKSQATCTVCIPYEAQEASASGNGAHDPRSIIAEFFSTGDERGPLGSLKSAGLTVNPDASKQTNWFTVFRPCSEDAINNMCVHRSTGKGLNIKGKSAKCGKLSGLVPFLQISENKHKFQTSTPPKDSRFCIYYQSSELRESALQCLNLVLSGMLERITTAKAKLEELDKGTLKVEAEEEVLIYADINLAMSHPTITYVNHFVPQNFGLEMPEKVLREAYIVQKDIVPAAGWETGRESSAAFMDMNLHALRDAASDPKPVLSQFDTSDAMNPRGLVMAYTEDMVLPVVSDFDPFLIGSRGMQFKPISDEDVKLIKWCLSGIKEILEAKGTSSWTKGWLEILKREAGKGFHPELPKYGFGDPSSYQIVSDLVDSTGFCGAVRHGAECFNWYFPQELDPEFLVIWDGFSKGGLNQWSYLSEQELRAFLLDRLGEGFCFPLNPAWTLRDQGWYEVLTALRSSISARAALASWYPPGSGILEEIDAIHAAYPAESVDRSKLENAFSADRLDPCELADAAELELRRHIVLRRAARKLRAVMMWRSLLRKKPAPGGNEQGNGQAAQAGNEQ